MGLTLLGSTPTKRRVSMDRRSRFQWGPDDLEIVYEFKVVYRRADDEGDLSEVALVYKCYEKDEEAAVKAFRCKNGEKHQIISVTQESS
jgi:hypothetical protein